MKLLSESFTGNFEGSGDTLFTQIKMASTPTLNVYIYRRDWKRHSTYEVFMAKRRYAGQALPGGAVETEDREQYPRANAFGFTAKETRTLIGAEVFFNEFVQKLQDKSASLDEPGDFETTVKEKLEAPKQRGRKRIERPDLVYPTTASWTMKELTALNAQWSQPTAYVQLQKDISAGEVVEVGRVSSGKGKPAVQYKVVTA